MTLTSWCGCKFRVCGKVAARCKVAGTELRKWTLLVACWLVLLWHPVTLVELRTRSANDSVEIRRVGEESCLEAPQPRALNPTTVPQPLEHALDSVS